jgi:hypothetical protein
MTISSNIDARRFREAYGRLDDAGTPTAVEIVGVCNDAFAAVATEFKRHGYGVENSDAAEELVGLILRFFLQSNPSFQGAIPPERTEG